MISVARLAPALMDASRRPALSPASGPSAASFRASDDRGGDILELKPRILGDA